jgi:hypothetical protein
VSASSRAIFVLAAVMAVGCSQILGADFEGGHLRDEDAGSAAAANGGDSATTDAGSTPDADVDAGPSVPPHIVLFGGLGEAAFDDTWTWDGTKWTWRKVTPHPPGRYHHAMATLGRKVVLFGGWGEANGGTLYDDTWVWDGNAWEEKHPAHKPTPREGHLLATRNGEVILYGGTTDQETWSWDGTDWSHDVTAGYPPRAVFCLGGSGDGIVLLGTDDVDANAKADTWLYQTNQWSLLGGSSSLTRDGCTMSTLPDGRIVLFGLSGDETWMFSTAHVWSKLATTSTPDNRNQHAMATLDGKPTIFGGALGGDTGYYYNDTWVLEGNAWKKMPTDVAPSFRFAHAMAAIP